MKASLRSVRIAPKKANLIAPMIRGRSVLDAFEMLGRINKKAARLFEALVRSAVANAKHNDRQTLSHLMIKSLVVNQGSALHRSVPMARGRVRPLRKFMSHIHLTLGLVLPAEPVSAATSQSVPAVSNAQPVVRKSSREKSDASPKKKSLQKGSSQGVKRAKMVTKSA